ncbi:MAG: cytochrome c-type biogenesis protein [Chloroflexota bacterium]
MKRIFWLSLLVLVVASLWVGIAAAQQPTPSDDEVNAIAKQLYCPVCENTPLDVCPTEACRQWRDLIRQMLAEGRTEAEIKQHFVENYGARVLAEPPAQGLNWLVYVVPPVAFTAGAVLLFFAFRSWRRLAKQEAVKDAPEPVSVVDDEYVSRIEEELRRRN